MLKRKKKTSNIRKIIGVLFCGVAIGIGFVALSLQKEKEEEEKESIAIYDEVRSKATKIQVSEDGEEELIIDWDSLEGYSIVGWIKVGDAIDYPIVQGKDNQYYLKHTYEGTYNANGSIFMSCLNNADFMDRNTIIYGHNMQSKVMFGSIKEWLSYSEDNPTEFDIYLPNGTKHTYDIYSIDKVKDLGFAYTTQFETLKKFDEYKDEMKEQSEYDFGVDKTNKKTVMLSTCNSYGSASGNRVVVLGQEREVKKIQEPASWYVERKYIEVNNKKATYVTGTDGYYYILQDGYAIKCIKDALKYVVIEDEDVVIVRVEYTDTNKAYKYVDLNGEESVYPIVEIYDYVRE